MDQLNAAQAVASAHLVVLDAQLELMEARDAEIAALGIDWDALERERDDDLEAAHRDRESLDRLSASLGSGPSDDTLLSAAREIDQRFAARAQRYEARRVLLAQVEQIDAKYALDLA
ncbi:hypothetical protein [Streptacidiphilus sp. MAP5-52]|uniref:hypothetical protein n=1 Tax=Streptacidiphilus sp. MAP5-52 TaxID=3156267 RepID=UPI003517A092